MAQGLSAMDGRLPGSFLLHTPTASSLSFHFGLPLPAVVGGLKSLQHNVDPMINVIPFGASLVAQWLRICLPMQRTRVRALVWEDPTCRGATKPEIGRAHV